MNIFKRKRILKWVLFCFVAAAITVCAQGCSLWKKGYSETIVIDPPEEEERQTVPSVMEIKTIYPVLDNNNDGLVIGWNSNNSLVSLNYNSARPKVAYDKSRSPQIVVEQIKQPYVSRVKLMDLQVSMQGWKGAVLAPKGKKLAYIADTDDGLTLNYIYLDESMKGGGKVFKVREINADSYVKEISWSQNDKYLALLLTDENDRNFVCVYDTEADVQSMGKCYSLDISAEAFYYNSVYISDDGTSAAMIRYWNQNRFQLEYGKLQNESFHVKYIHPTPNYHNFVQWIHPDQIVFIGEDKKLYAYDQRNDSVSILMEEVMQFRLSQDKQFIVIAKHDETVQIANLYGNNIVNIKQIYKGIDGFELLWSPDNKRIMISGVIRERKTFELIAGMPSQLVIEFE